MADKECASFDRKRIVDTLRIKLVGLTLPGDTSKQRCQTARPDMDFGRCVAEGA